MFRNQSVQVIGVPLGLGGLRRGANLGPDALRLAGIVEQLAPLVEEVRDLGDVPHSLEVGALERGEGIGHFDHILENLVRVRDVVGRCIDAGSIPLVLGGDHSVELATIPRALAIHGEQLGVLWIDAHADFNTPDTSPSGNLHGMVLAGVCGLEAENSVGVVRDQWQRLRSALEPSGSFLDSRKVAWLGLRDVDSGERERIEALGVRHAVTMHEIDRYGVAAMFEHAIDMLCEQGVSKLWVSFDADVLDPMIAPGTGTHVRGGLTYREAHLLGEMLHEALSDSMTLVGIKIAEVNPILDQQNSTANLCVEWAASLFGKRILGSWSEA